ncbi:MAG: ABC transporter ATP-binding protein [Bauldia sp.]
MALATFADVAMPLFAGRLVDAIAGGVSAEARSAALAAFAAIVGLAVCSIGLRQASFAGIVRLTLSVMRGVAADAFARVQRLGTDWHANTFAGSTVRKITRGMWAIDMLDDVLLVSLLPSAVVLIGSTVLLGLRWPVVGAVVAVGSLLFIAMTTALSLRFVAPASRLSNQWDTKLGGAIADAVGCNAVVKAFGGEAREDLRLSRLTQKWAARTRRTWLRHNLNSFLQMTATLAMRIAVIGTVLWLWWQGEASPGDLTYVLTAFFMIQGFLREVGQHIRNLQRSVNDMEEMVGLLDQPLGVKDRPNAPDIAIAKGGIVFEHVGFHYGTHSRPLYTDLNVAIAPGERVGLVGHSGSGKTTFVKLIQRLYDVTAGRILIDGVDIAGVAQASLRAEIAIVQQEPILFHRSLADNIAYGRPGASIAEIVEAARLANAHDFVARLPNGYATLVGERGVKLSGGERQRVALARAFLADAPILILDEATSSLDSESEALIQEAMARLMKGRTTIVVAHRLSTVRVMDRILVFDRGRIAEEGDHAALLRRDNGIYRRLFDRQASDLAKGLPAERFLLPAAPTKVVPLPAMR